MSVDSLSGWRTRGGISRRGGCLGGSASLILDVDAAFQRLGFFLEF